MRHPLHVVGREQAAAPLRPLHPQIRRSVQPRHVHRAAIVAQGRCIDRGRGVADVQGAEQPVQQLGEPGLLRIAVRRQGDARQHVEQLGGRCRFLAAQQAAERVAERQVEEGDRQKRDREGGHPLHRHDKDQQRVERQQHQDPARVEQGAQRPEFEIEQAIARHAQNEARVDQQEQGKGPALADLRLQPEHLRQRDQADEAARADGHRQAEPAQRGTIVRFAAGGEHLARHGDQDAGHQRDGRQVDQQVRRRQQTQEAERGPGAEDRRHRPGHPSGQIAGRIDHEQVHHPDPEDQGPRGIEGGRPGKDGLGQGQAAAGIERRGV